MTALNAKKKAAVACCCRCIGMCWPYTCMGEVCTLQEVNWEISAPNCTAIDGTTGVFGPLSPDNIVREMGTCGPCVCYDTIADIQLPVKRYLQVGGGPPPNPPQICNVVDDFIELQLFLATGNNQRGDCCNVRLLVHLRESSAFGLELCSGDPVGRDEFPCLPNVTNPPPSNFRVYSPVSCECLSGTTGFAATFDLSEIAFCCPLGNWDGACAPNSRCPVLFQCSLTDATLTI